MASTTLSSVAPAVIRNRQDVPSVTWAFTLRMKSSLIPTSARDPARPPDAAPIAALEQHVRALTETVQANQVDLAAGWIAILVLQAQVDEKVSSSDVDPTLGELNQQLAAAREQLEKSSTAASESWATLQGGVRDSFETLRASVNQAAERAKKG